MRLEKTIGVAVIGTGFMGSLYARICAQTPGVEVVALCDLVAERVEALAQEVGAVAYAGFDYASMFKKHSGIDVVLVCTREDSHRDPALAALEAGKHVLVEKPLATNVRDAEAMVEAARGNAHSVAMVAHTLRFDPRFVRMKQTVAQNDLGEIVHLYARRTPTYSTLERIDGRVELPYWVGVHDIDMMRWLTSSEVVRVNTVSTLKGVENRGVKRSILSLLTFKSGAIAALENAWGPENGPDNQQAASVFRVLCTRGVVEITTSNQGLAVNREGGTSSPDVIGVHQSYGRITGMYAEQINYLLSCIRLGKVPEPGLVDGLRSAMVAEAIMRSAETTTEIVL